MSPARDHSVPNKTQSPTRQHELLHVQFNTILKSVIVHVNHTNKTRPPAAIPCLHPCINALLWCARMPALSTQSSIARLQVHALLQALGHTLLSGPQHIPSLQSTRNHICPPPLPSRTTTGSLPSPTRAMSPTHRLPQRRHPSTCTHLILSYSSTWLCVRRHRHAYSRKCAMHQSHCREEPLESIFILQRAQAQPLWCQCSWVSLQLCNESHGPLCMCCGFLHALLQQTTWLSVHGLAALSHEHQCRCRFPCRNDVVAVAMSGGGDHFILSCQTRPSYVAIPKYRPR